MKNYFLLLRKNQSLFEKPFRNLGFAAYEKPFSDTLWYLVKIIASFDWFVNSYFALVRFPQPPRMPARLRLLNRHLNCIKLCTKTEDNA